jgi:hypothetical protein
LEECEFSWYTYIEESIHGERRKRDTAAQTNLKKGLLAMISKPSVSANQWHRRLALVSRSSPTLR